MKGDFTRFTFDKKKHYNKVKLQQGRVQVDADWNELVDIQDYHDTICLKDIIGQSGGPIDNAGFLIEKKEDTNGIESLLIGKGRYYIDGILIENDAKDDVKISKQIDYPWFKKDGTRLNLNTNIEPGIYLAYLDVWERHITALDDSEIRESALGVGADTTTRSKVVWQVKLNHIDKDLPVSDKSFDWKILASGDIPILEKSKHPIAIVQNPAQAKNLVIFGISPFLANSSAVFFSVQNIDNPESWEPWKSLNAVDNDNKDFLEIAADVNSLGLIEVFAIGIDGLVYHTVQQNKGDLDKWHSWVPLNESSGLSFSEIAVGKNNDGFLEVFAIIRLGPPVVQSPIVYHTTEIPANAETDRWKGWEPIESPNVIHKSGFEQIAVGKNKDGRLQIMGINSSDGSSDGPVLFMEQENTSNIWTGKWNLLGRDGQQQFKQVIGDNNENGNFEVFGIGSKDNIVYHQALPGNGKWKSLNETVKFKQIKVGKNQDKCLEVYGIGLGDEHDNVVYRNVQPEPNADAEQWNGPWESLDESFKFDQVEVAFSNLENHLEVFGIHSSVDRIVYHLDIQQRQNELDCDISIPSWEMLISSSTGTLQARSKKEEPSKDPCMIPPAGGGYRRLENQLYRVEIHDSSKGLEGATFKYSRDNGTVVTRVNDISGKELSITSSGRDTLLGFASGQWVEITDDSRELYGTPGTMVKLKGDINDTKLTLDLDTTKGDKIINENFAQEFNPKVRRWDSVDGVTKIQSTADNEGFLPLEDGIEVKFDRDKSYFTGDYWLVPARTNKGDIEWPTKEDRKPESLLPKGIEHHYCRLAIVKYTKESIEIKDCRHLFSPLTKRSGFNIINTGKIHMRFIFRAGEGGEVKAELVSGSFDHGLVDIVVPPAIILAIESPTNDKEVSYMEDDVLYKFGKGHFRVKPVDINLKNFKIKAENINVDGSPTTGTLDMKLRFWAIPAKEIGAQSGERSE